MAIILHPDKSSSSDYHVPVLLFGGHFVPFCVFSDLAAISLVGLVVFFSFAFSSFILSYSTIFPNESSLAIRFFGVIFFLSVLDHVFVKEFGLWLCYDMDGLSYGIFAEWNYCLG